MLRQTRLRDEMVLVDGIKWHIVDDFYAHVQPICPVHHLRMGVKSDRPTGVELLCEECTTPVKFSRSFDDERRFAMNKANSVALRAKQFVNLDNEQIPIAEDKAEVEGGKYFVVARLMKSKVGLRLVVYAGEKGKKNKTQIFVEPEIKRLAFDQKDLHPTDVFLSLEGTFPDGTKGSIEK